MKVELEPIEVETESEDHEGRLVLAGGKLVGILVRLSGVHGVWSGFWNVEWLAEMLHHPPPFKDLRSAKGWFAHRYVA